MNDMGVTYFWICAALAVIGALATIAGRNPIRCAMGLLLMILAIAGLFLSLQAQFLAVIQLIVYAGAIVVLFLFVIMLLGPNATTVRDRRGIFARAFGGALFALASAGAMFLVVRGGKAALLQATPAGFGGVDGFGRVLFSDGLVPFELSSALLMVAVIGAVAVAKGRQSLKAADVPTALAARATKESVVLTKGPEGAVLPGTTENPKEQS